MTRCAALAIVLFAALATPAAGSGGPVAGTDVGAAGVTAPGVANRYAAIRVPGGTLITQVERRDGRTIDSRFASRRLVVPAVALDNSATGLSADGRTLVLAAPRRRGVFVVFDTESLQAHATIGLRGDFTLDAISPDGDTLYLIESTSRRDVSRYAVRAYDIGARRLRPGAIVDPEEPDEPMRGSPVSRAVSPDGRWAYTLYDGDGGPHPFIHALDTQRGRAKCIDLDALSRDETYSMVLRVGRDGLVNVRPAAGGASVLAVDPSNRQVRRPGSAAPKTAPAPARDAGGTGWFGLAAGALVLALLGAVALRAGRRGRPGGGLGRLRL
jgi:hypothetical protein